jgi:hypothetical protein
MYKQRHIDTRLFRVLYIGSNAPGGRLVTSGYDIKIPATHTFEPDETMGENMLQDVLQKKVVERGCAVWQEQCRPGLGRA